MKERCPCGRDRAYHECCGKPGKVVSLAQAKWRKASVELRKRLGEFAEEVVFLKEAASAQEVYFAQCEDDVHDLDDDLVIERCFEWFIFDYPLSSGQTLIELFSEVCGPRLPFTQAVLLVLWRDAYAGFYEVKTVFPGKGLVLKDLFSGESVRVREPGAGQDITVGSILYVRLLRVGDEYEFSTSAMGIPEVLRAELVDWLRADYRNWRRAYGRGKDKVWSAYLRSQAHRLNGHIVRLGLGLTATTPFHDRDGGQGVILSLMSLFQRDVLKRVCATREGREQLEELLHLIQSAEEIRQVRRYLSAGRSRSDKGRKPKAHIEAWPDKAYAQVASEITAGLDNLGFHREEIKNAALRLWHDFCCQEKPALRKPSAWTAAVIYAAIREEERQGLSQYRLAQMYGVAPSSVSSNFRRLCLVTSNQPDDDSIMPGSDLMKIEPLIEKILHDID